MSDHESSHSSSDEDAIAIQMEALRRKQERIQQKKREEKERQEAAARKAEADRKAAEVAEKARKEAELAEKFRKDGEAWAHELNTTQGTGIIRSPRDCQRCVRRGTECVWPAIGKGKSCRACIAAKQKCEVEDIEEPEVGKKRKRKAEGGTGKGKKKKTAATVGSDADESEFGGHDAGVEELRGSVSGIHSELISIAETMKDISDGLSGLQTSLDYNFGALIASVDSRVEGRIGQWPVEEGVQTEDPGETAEGAELAEVAAA